MNVWQWLDVLAYQLIKTDPGRLCVVQASEWQFGPDACAQVRPTPFYFAGRCPSCTGRSTQWSARVSIVCICAVAKLLHTLSAAWQVQPVGFQ